MVNCLDIRTRRSNTGFGFGFLYPFGTFSRYFNENAAKLTKSKKSFRNRVVTSRLTTFNAKLTLFGDHIWAIIPNLH